MTKLDRAKDEQFHRYPSFLPDGRHFLYTAGTQVFVSSLDAADPKPLISASVARYAPPGWLLFIRDGAVMAQTFDDTRLELSGNPTALFGEGTRTSLSDTGAGAGD